MQLAKQQLNDGWTVREVPSDGAAAHNILPPLPARVPGHVHRDLERSGVIPDPFARLHERDVAWVDETDWIYETTFRPERLPSAGEVSYLLFHGLDTVAEIDLNGVRLGATDNMFVTHEFAVTDKLIDGENSLRITFRAAKRIGEQRHDLWEQEGNDTATRHWDNWNARSFVRKAQYMFGWDWSPVLISCGIWKPVELVTVPTARIVNWSHDVEFSRDGSAIVTVSARIERAPSANDLPLTFTVEATDGAFSAASVTLSPGADSVETQITIEGARLWQPSGLGDPNLYAIRMRLSAPGTHSNSAIDEISASIGLRTIELVREPDADGRGEGFQFVVNGNPVFIKGANWIPNECFPSDGEVRSRIEQARDAGFNMLRIWGGGLYESEEFYDACDEMGLLVWQDFAYACAYYPDAGVYAEAAAVEARAAIERLRNRASLALWCGNNENYVMYQGKWGGVQSPRLIGEYLYEKILPDLVSALDPKTPYWISSPYGGEHSNSADYGDCHNWDVWHGRGDWIYYAENNSRFCSEFGFSASCGMAAWDSCLAPEDKHPESPAVEWHNKTRKNYDVYLGYVDLHYPKSKTLEDVVYYTQLNQAEALKFGIEHYRRLKGRCWGTLFWQLNDCWPVHSWAIVDYLGEPKAAYYACKKFYAPILVSLVRDGKKITAHLVNDHLHEITGALTLSLEKFDGTILASQTTDATVASNGTALVAGMDCSAAEGLERETYLHARFTPNGSEAPVENLILFAEPKDLSLTDPNLTIDLKESRPEEITVALKAQSFAPYVWLKHKENTILTLSDNYFHLRAGEAKTVTISTGENGAMIFASLSARTLRPALTPTPLPKVEGLS